MNYYRRYIGDYQRDTSRLSLTEHGAYGKLLDAYYADDGPLPADESELFRIAGAMNPAEQAAVRVVAAKYFTRAGNHLSNARADAEIALGLVAIERSRTNGKRGGRPPKETQPETQRVTVEETQQGTQQVIKEPSRVPSSKAIHPPTTTTTTTTTTTLRKKPRRNVDNLPDGFVDAWANYPKRSGSNSRAKALTAYAVRLAGGVTVEALAAGVDRYRAFCDATGNTGTKWVMQAVRFFGPAGEWAEDWTLPTDSQRPATDKISTAHSELADWADQREREMANG